MKNNIIQFITKKTGTSWSHKGKGNKQNPYEGHGEYMNGWYFMLLLNVQ